MLFREATRMIHIEHLAFWTRDLERLAAFYAEAFGAAVGEGAVKALQQGGVSLR